MKAYVCTEKGNGKAASDDRVLVGKSILGETSLTMAFDSGSVAVADGVGGNLAGDAAAYMVCGAAARMGSPMEGAFREVNREIIRLGEFPKYKNMATTLSGVYWDTEANPVLYHVGNTRIYSIQGSGYLKQLTEDDTVVEFLLKTGKLTQEEAENYSARNEITACFGGGKEDLLKIKIYTLEDKPEKLLMTSDGVHETLSLDEMEDCFDEYQDRPEDFVKKLVSLAKEKGSMDDCTAVFMDREE